MNFCYTIYNEGPSTVIECCGYNIIGILVFGQQDIIVFSWVKYLEEYFTIFLPCLGGYRCYIFSSFCLWLLFLLFQVQFCCDI